MRHISSYHFHADILSCFISPSHPAHEPARSGRHCSSAIYSLHVFRSNLKLLLSSSRFPMETWTLQPRTEDDGNRRPQEHAGSNYTGITVNSKQLGLLAKCLSMLFRSITIAESFSILPPTTFASKSVENCFYLVVLRFGVAV